MAEKSFEKALAELEDIVAKMEKGGLTLNESLSLFEKGVKLARFLREELEKAEKKTEILLKDEQGQMKAEPFELTQEEPDREEEKAAQDNETPGSGENNDLPF
jgi:exodeoxyribonuclease VII small subunit